MIKYLTGDATRPDLLKPTIIAHICNDKGGWGRGFVVAISKRWPEPEQHYRRWHQAGKDFALGEIQVVEVQTDLWVCNMLAQKGYGGAEPPIRYEALRECLGKLAEVARRKEALIAMPRIGTGLAGGKWDTVCQIIEETLGNLTVHVYDLPS